MAARQLPADKESKHAKERSVLTCKLAHVVPCLLLPDLLSAVLSDLTSNLAVAFPVLSTGTQYTTHTHHHQDLFCASDDTVVGVGGGPQQRNFFTATSSLLQHLPPKDCAANRRHRDLQENFSTPCSANVTGCICRYRDAKIQSRCGTFSAVPTAAPTG